MNRNTTRYILFLSEKQQKTDISRLFSGYYFTRKHPRKAVIRVKKCFVLISNGYVLERRHATNSFTIT